MRLRFSVANSRRSRRPAATTSLPTESTFTYVPEPHATTQHAHEAQTLRQNQASSDFDIVYDVGFQQPLSSSSSPKPTTSPSTPPPPTTISSSDAGLTTEEDDVPCCWVCLEEESDASGNPLVRDCSCRGSAGFAHLSCIIKYAEIEGMKECEKNNYHFHNITKYFKCCPNCKQDYQKELKCDLSKACLSFIESQAHDDTSLAKYLHIVALIDRIFVLCSGNEEGKSSEGELLCSRLLSHINEMKSSIQARAYYAIGCFHGNIGSLSTAKEYCEKARDLLLNAGDKSSFNLITTVRAITEIDAKINGNGLTRDASSDVEYLRRRYEEFLPYFGEETSSTIDAGVKLANALCKADRHEEADRLLSHLVSTSHRVHGPHHRCTQAAASALQTIRSKLSMHVDR